jgi:hypothetical protein
MFELPATLVVVNMGTEDSYAPSMRWSVNYDVSDTLLPFAIQNYPIPHGYSSTCFRWIVDWVVETPKDYSLWITHPSHRNDLPFFTINGFVDTDKHPNNLLLPFFIREGFEGEIEKGTPIAQVIPVKRDSWVSEKAEFNHRERNKGFDAIKSQYNRGYKKLFWVKKTYK